MRILTLTALGAALLGALAAITLALTLSTATATPARPATRSATAADLRTVLSAAKAGDTVIVTGAVERLPGQLPAGVTLDLKAATVTGNSRLARPSGLTLVGGTWTGSAPLFIRGGQDVRIIDPVMQGAEPRGATAIMVLETDGLTISGATIRTYKNGIVLQQVARFLVDRVRLEDMRADGVQGAAIWDGVFRKVSIRGTRKTGKEHSDGIQVRSLAGQRPTGNILFDEILAVGDVQAIVGTDHGQGGFDDITVRGARIVGGQPRAISFADGRGITLEDNQVETYPGSPYQARIITNNATGVTLVGRNAYADYGGKRGAVLRERQTSAEAEARLAAASTRVDALERQAAALAAKVAAARAALD